MRILQDEDNTGTGCQRKDCKYHSASGCSYFMVEGHTRTFIHDGEDVDINNPCREYARGPKVLLNIKPFTVLEDLK